MPALPRPDLPPGAHRDLVDALHDLHHRAGWPSLRTLPARRRLLPHHRLQGLLLPASPPGAPSSSSSRRWTATPPTSTTSGSPPPLRTNGTVVPDAADRRTHRPSSPPYDVTSRPAPDSSSSPARPGSARPPSSHGRRRADAFVATGHCLPLSTEVPLLPFADCLRSVHDADDGDGSTEARRRPARPTSHSRLRACSRSWRRDARHRPRGRAASPVHRRRRGPPGARAQRRPLAVLLEDLHWADVATLDLLEHLLGRGRPRAPSLGAWRTEDDSVPPSQRRLVRRECVACLPSRRSTLARSPATRPPSSLPAARRGRAGAGRPHPRPQPRGSPSSPSSSPPTRRPTGLPALLADLLDRRLDQSPTPLGRAPHPRCRRTSARARSLGREPARPPES